MPPKRACPCSTPSSSSNKPAAKKTKRSPPPSADWVVFDPQHDLLHRKVFYAAAAQFDYKPGHPALGPYCPAWCDEREATHAAFDNKIEAGIAAAEKCTNPERARALLEECIRTINEKLEYENEGKPVDVQRMCEGGALCLEVDDKKKTKREKRDKNKKNETEIWEGANMCRGPEGQKSCAIENGPNFEERLKVWRQSEKPKARLDLSRKRWEFMMEVQRQMRAMITEAKLEGKGEEVTESVSTAESLSR